MQRPARRCGAREHAHGRHDDGRDHRRHEEIRGQAVGAPREEQDEAVAGDDAAAELTTRLGEIEIRPFFEAADLADFVTPEELATPRSGERGKLGVA